MTNQSNRKFIQERRAQIEDITMSLEMQAIINRLYSDTAALLREHLPIPETSRGDTTSAEVQSVIYAHYFQHWVRFGKEAIKP